MPSNEIPFFRSAKIRSLSKVFIGVGDILNHILPHTDALVDQSGVRERYGVSGREYLAVVFTVSLIMLLGVGGGLTLMLLAGGADQPFLGLGIGVFLAAAMFFYMMMYPRSIVNKRVKYIERNLLYALRSILVQIRSGVPVFNAMASIALGQYGPLSDQFQDVIEKVNAGEPMVGVLEQLAVRNPSPYFRRALWQLVNSLKSGSDVGDNLEDVIRNLSKEQLVEIREYKSTLNPIAMMYMMVAVIVPSLGITLLIILSSFPGMGSFADEKIFWALLVFTIFMQFMFLGIIKSKRPNLIGG
ncbi:MAG: hypothetical protein GF334_12160 [Candidatus Altiarchaeales archaeon]|nr:hypothetical protein [Candidatus Altiarchaeales archaeon]